MKEENKNGPVPYWWIRNSWGKKWSDDGYAKMLRGQNFAAMEYGGLVARWGILLSHVSEKWGRFAEFFPGPKWFTSTERPDAGV